MMSDLLDRRAVVRELLRDPADCPGGELLVVTGLGSTTYDAGAAGDRPENFYLWGAMGGAAMIGLGLALARPDTPVLVLTGDGEQLMGLGALATVGARAPKNLSIVVLDNRLYGETGMQASHTGRGVDLVAVAAGCAFGWTMRVDSLEQAGPLHRREARPGQRAGRPIEAARVPPRGVRTRTGSGALALPTI
jgi:thiamine pyrophosphate-dependent acetolactate synthase large subunit-like protein